MRRGLAKLANPPSAAFSSFSGAGSGRGRGLPTWPILGQPPSPAVGSSEEDSFIPAGRGRGRGSETIGAAGSDSSSPVLPSFPSFLASAGLGRGRGSGTNPKKPIFFVRDEETLNPGSKPPQSDLAPPEPISDAPQPVQQENRHLKKREEAQKKALETLGSGLSAPSPTPGGRGAATAPARGGMRGRGRGMRGGRSSRGRGGRSGGRGSMEEIEEDLTMYLGDNASGERLEKKLGEEKMKVLENAFEEATSRNLPSPLEDAFFDAQHTNNMIEYEPEYLVNFENPDIDEKPPMSLEEALETAKPFLVAYEGIQNQEEWEEAVKEVMKRLPHMQNLIDIYCGPDRITAKEQEKELKRVADTIPQNVPGSVKRFTDKVLLSLQSNPGWGYDKKYIFMDKLAREINQQYK